MEIRYSYAGKLAFENLKESTRRSILAKLENTDRLLRELGQEIFFLSTANSEGERMFMLRGPGQIRVMGYYNEQKNLITIDDIVKAEGG